MLVQIASDIHIEKLYPNKAVITDFIIPNENAEMLILAGDIGSIYQYDEFRHFFLSCKQHFKFVLYVTGNNEYYLREGFEPKSMSQLDNDIIRLCQETNVILLNNAYIETETHIIFGSTWWSHIPDTLTMRVYKDNGKPIDADDFNHMHNIARRCLNKIVEKKGDKKLIVISHYCPTKFGTMNMHHKKSDFNDLVPYYFSSSEKYLKGAVDVWIYGHTHVFRDFYFDNQYTRIISNADPRKRFFKKNFCIEF